MKKIIFKATLFILLPFLLSSFFKSRDIKEFVYSLVIALDFFALSIFVFIKRDELTGKIKGMNETYKTDRLVIPATIKSSYVTRKIAHNESKSEKAYYYQTELCLEIAYNIDNIEYSKTVSRLIGFIRKDDHTYDAGNILSVYVDKNDYNDVVLYSNSEYESSYRILKNWITTVSVIGMLGSIHIFITSFI